MGGRCKREGIHVYIWLIHVDVWQKPTKFCKAVTELSFNKKEIKKKKKFVWFLFSWVWVSWHLSSLTFCWVRENGGNTVQLWKHYQFSSVQLLSRVQLFATPWIAAIQTSLEFTQTHVHRIGDAIQPSHLLSSPSSPAPNASQHIVITKLRYFKTLLENSNLLPF